MWLTNPDDPYEGYRCPECNQVGAEPHADGCRVKAMIDGIIRDDETGHAVDGIFET